MAPVVKAACLYPWQGDHGPQEAAVAALAALMADNDSVTVRVGTEAGAVAALLEKLRDRSPAIQLLSASCLTQLLRCSGLRVAGLEAGDEVRPLLSRHCRRHACNRSTDSGQNGGIALKPRVCYGDRRAGQSAWCVCRPHRGRC